MEWQPIETAPRDGTELLVSSYFPAYDLFIRDIVVWSAEDSCWEGKGLVWDNAKAKHLTHWMYVPEDPKQLVEHPNVSRETQEWD